MATTSTEIGAAPASMGLVSRFVGIITSPKATFQAIVAQPRWLGMLVLTTIIIAFCAALPMTTDAGKRATLDQQVQQMENFGIQVNDQVYADMQRRIAFAPYTTSAAILLLGPIF